MSLREGDNLISMDILPAQLTEEALENDEGDSEDLTEINPHDCDQGPWVLVITAAGLGKRVPVNNFRLQNRAGMGLVGIKFRKKNDELVALRVVSPRDELMLVTNRGIIIRQAICAISVQSRMATGVQLQRLDDDDEIAAVAVIPEFSSGETIDEKSVVATPKATPESLQDGTSEDIPVTEIITSEEE